MAKTIAEAELRGLCGVLETRLDTDRRDIADLWTADEAGRKRVEELSRELAALQQENAVLRKELDVHLKRYELWEARRWAFVMALVGAVLSLASGLIVTLARK